MNEMFTDYGYSAETFVLHAGINFYEKILGVRNTNLLNNALTPYIGGTDKNLWEENIRRECRENMFFFFTNFLKIREADSNVFKPFRWNRSKFLQIWLDESKIGSYIRAPRQISGKTTTIVGQVLYHQLFRNDMCIIVSDSCNKLHADLLKMNDELPDFLKPKRNIFKELVSNSNLFLSPNALEGTESKKMVEFIKAELYNRDVYVFIDDAELVDKRNPRFTADLIKTYREYQKLKPKDNILVICASGVSFKGAANSLRKQMQTINLEEISPGEISKPTNKDAFGYFICLPETYFSEYPEFEKWLTFTKVNLDEETYGYEIECKE